ncbi:hypothetical protein D3C81_2295330 [compost metagenome]
MHRRCDVPMRHALGQQAPCLIDDRGVTITDFLIPILAAEHATFSPNRVLDRLYGKGQQLVVL